MSVEIWSGIYEQWDDAVLAAEDGEEQVFDTDEWLHKVLGQLRDYRDDLATHGVALPPRPSNLPLVSSLVDPHSIVDFGGSSGWCWDYLRAVVPNSSVESYRVIETDNLVRFFGGSGHHQAPVSYHTTDDVSGTCDVLYSNSVLQYLSDNDPLIDLTARLSPRYILLDDLFAGHNPEFYSVQNYYGKKIPCRFMNLTKLDQDLTGLGYVFSARAAFDTPVLGVSQPKPMENFPPSHRLRYSMTTLYRGTRR